MPRTAPTHPQRKSPPPTPSASRPAALVATVAALLTVLAMGAVASAQTSSFPWPLVAPVLASEQPAPLDIRSLSIEAIDIGTTAVIRFGAPFEAPSDGYRVSIVVGEPDQPSRRASLTIDDGEQTGTIEEFVDGEWQPLDDTGAELASATGEVLISLPADALGSHGIVWAEAALDSELAVSPLFLRDDLEGQQSPPALGLSTAGWSDTSAPGAGTIDLGDVPELTLTDGTLEVTYSGVAPTAAGSSAVSRLIDVVKIAPGYELVDDAPYWITIDHTAGQISLLDATVAIPAEVDGGDAWLVEGIPTGGVAAGTVLRFDLDAVLGAFDLTSLADATGLGLARSVATDDGSEYRSDGVIGTLDWFRGDVQTVVSTTTVTSITDPTAVAVTQADQDSGGGGTSWPWLLLLVVLLGGGGFVLWYFVIRHRLAYRPDDLMVDPPVRWEPTAEEREALDDLNEQLFGE